MRQFFFVIFVIFLGGFLGFSEYRAIHVLTLQYQAQSYPHVSGTVTSSEVTSWRGSKGRQYYRVSISYSYSVDGASYTAQRYRYDSHPQDWEGADAVVQSHPQGLAVDVYYNPKKPADAVISTLVDDRDVGDVFFYAAMCLFLTWALQKASRLYDWPWEQDTVAGGMKLFSEGLITRVRLPVYSPLSVSLLTASGCSLAAYALMAFVFTTLSLSPLVAGVCLALMMVLGAAGAYFWFHQRVQTGRYDLVIDEGARTIRLPSTYDQHESPPVSWQQIKEVTVHRVRHQGYRGGAYYSFAVFVDLTGHAREKLIDASEGKANGLALWLHNKCKIPGPMPDEVEDDE